jgi:hypothetical protein
MPKASEGMDLNLARDLYMGEALNTTAHVIIKKFKKFSDRKNISRSILTRLSY